MGGLLWQNLRCQKKRKKRYGKIERGGSIPNRLFIEDRPAVVETRMRIGDWEADTIIGKNHRQALVSIVERKSGLTLIQKVERKTAQAVSDAMIKLLKPYRDKVHTITSDNGREFAKHENIAKALKADFYFAHPYASWERGNFLEGCQSELTYSRINSVHSHGYMTVEASNTALISQSVF